MRDLGARAAVRVLLVNKFSRVTGGADRVFLDLASWLRESGHDVKVLSTQFRDNEEAEGVFVPASVTSDNRDLLRGRAAARAAVAAVWNRQAYGAAQSLIRAHRPDVVHTFKLYPQLSVAPVIAAHRAGIPIVQTALDYEFISANQFDDGGSRRDRWETKFTYRRLNESLHVVRRRYHLPRLSRVVTCSRYMAAKYAAHEIEAEVAPNPVRRFDGARPGWQDRSGAVFAARLHPTKGVLDVIRTAELVPETTFTIVGRGPLDDEVKRAAERLPNLVRLEWVPLPELRRLLAGARVLLTPSRWEEPGALVSLEAMATGTPLISYRAGGLTEYIEDANAGVVVDSTPEALATAVREVSRSQESWSGFSAAGLRAAAAADSPERYVRRFVRIYEEVSQASRRASATVTSS